MRVFVTGAGGFIGSEVVRVLAERDHEVIALHHSPETIPPPRPGVEAVVGDVVRPATYEPAARDADAIVHLALPGVDVSYRRAHPVWIDGTRSLLALARERNVRAFVHASGALGMYRHEPGAWIDESTPERPSTRFSRGRHEADAIARAAARDHGLAVAVLRPPTVYGRGGLFAKFFLDGMRRGRFRVPGDGSNLTGFVHVADCAAAYALAAETSPTGAFLVADDAPLTLREAADAIAEALGVRRPKSVPPLLARLVVGRDAIAIATESVRVRNARIRALGWRPQFASLRDGLREGRLFPSRSQEAR